MVAGGFFLGALGALHVWAAFGALRGRRLRLQRALAILYLITCPVRIVWAAPGIWGGATILALLYVGFFSLGVAYAVFALCVVRR